MDRFGIRKNVKYVIIGMLIFFTFAATSQSANEVSVNLSNDTGLSGSTVSLNFSINDTVNQTSFYNFTMPAGFNIIGSIVNFIFNGVANPDWWINTTGSNSINISSGGTYAYSGVVSYINISNVTLPVTGGATFIYVTTNNIMVPVDYTVIGVGGSPNITSFSPASPVSDTEGATRVFNVISNQTVNVTWYINGTQAGFNESVTTANYSNTSAAPGIWIVNATATNANGTASKEWTWNVTSIIINPRQKYVNSTGWWNEGGPFNSSNTPIQSAINNAIAGDSISVYSGTYNENINVNKSVTLSGINTGIGLPVVNALNPNLPVFELTVNGTILDGFIAANSTGDAGFHIDSSHNILTNSSAYSNSMGIEIHSVFLNNTIFKNKMYNNSINAVNDNSINCRWNNSVVGNYYDNITSVDNNNDGINDIPYQIDANGIDYLPLIVTTKASSPATVTDISSFTITTDYADHASVGIQNISLYFNLSNSSGIYSLYGNSSTGTFTFVPPSYGEYYFYTVSIDDNGVVEGIPTTYDSSTNVMPGSISFQSPTPANSATLYQNYVYINTSISNYSTAFIDWNGSSVGWWRFNGESGESASLFRDWSSWGNNGTCSWPNCPYSTSGNFGNALNMDGSDDYVIVQNSTSLNPSNITLEIWFNATSGGLAGQKPLIHKAYTTNADPYYQYMLSLADTSGSPKSADFYLAIGGVMQYVEVKNLNYDYAQWHYLAGTYNGSIMTMYLDGEAVGTTAIVGTITPYNTPVEFGAYTNLAKNPSYVFKGKLDEARIHSRALSANEINASYNAGINRLYHNFTNLSGGVKNYRVYAQSLSGSVNQTEARTLTIMTTEPGTPVITGYAPESPVTNNVSDSRTFNLTIDQTVNVTWYINGTQAGFNESVRSANYTNTSAASGIWNVSAVVSNTNGTDIQTWIWNVSSLPSDSPEISDYSPTSPVNDTAGSNRTFNITIDQTVNVTWYINGTQAGFNESVRSANYTNISAASGIWNVSAVVNNTNGTAIQTWIWNVSSLPSDSPVITSFAPVSLVNNTAGSNRTFNLTIDQTVNVTWYINGTQAGFNESVRTANYTNTSAVAGIWNVSAIVNNTNGTAIQTWIWNVGIRPVVTISVPVNNTNISIFNRMINGSITHDSAITATMSVNSVVNNTWSTTGNFRWSYDFVENSYNIINISAIDASGNYNESIVRIFVLSSLNETTHNLTANQSVNITTNASTGADIELTNGNTTANVTIMINGSRNASDFNASNIDTEFVALGLSRNSLSRFVEINATGDVTNLSSVKLTMFYDDSDLDVNGNGITTDVGDINEDTLNLYWYWDNATGSTTWFSLTTGADYSDKLDRANNSGPIVLGVVRNVTMNYISVTMNHFSTYSIAGELIAAQTTPSGGGSSGGSGGGGGGVVTGEPYDNIARSETYEKSLVHNKSVLYTFKLVEHGIYEIGVTGKESENSIVFRVEALKGPTKMAGISAPTGVVYKNLNIWSGSKRINEGLIRFKVENRWIDNNNFVSSDIVLIKWDGSQWVKLVTLELKKDNTYTFYEAKTESFSNFAISAFGSGTVVPTPPPQTQITATSMPAETETSVPTEKKTPGFEVIIAIFAIAMIVVRLKNSK